jgi:hypothetical protein
MILKLANRLGWAKKPSRPAMAAGKPPLENVTVVRNDLHDCDVEVVAKREEPAALSTFKLEGARATVVTPVPAWRNWSEKIQVWKKKNPR